MVAFSSPSELVAIAVSVNDAMSGDLKFFGSTETKTHTLISTDVLDTIITLRSFSNTYPFYFRS